MNFDRKAMTHVSANRRGFTLIELMIVVAIIAIVAAIAIPSLLAARKSGNQASAISSLRTLASVSQQYRTRFQTYAQEMTDLVNAGYIDEVLGSSVKAGYDFFYAGTGEVWLCFANPRNLGTTGDNFYFVNESGVISFNTTKPASATDPPID